MLLRFISHIAKQKQVFGCWLPCPLYKDICNISSRVKTKPTLFSFLVCTVITKTYKSFIAPNSSKWGVSWCRPSYKTWWLKVPHLHHVVHPLTWQGVQVSLAPLDREATTGLERMAKSPEEFLAHHIRPKLHCNTSDKKIFVYKWSNRDSTINVDNYPFDLLYFVNHEESSFFDMQIYVYTVYSIHKKKIHMNHMRYQHAFYLARFWMVL